MNGEKLNIFTGEDGEIPKSAEYHNVAENVLPNVDEATKQKAAKRYASRVGLMARAEEMWIATNYRDSDFDEHITYLSALFSEQLYTGSPQDIPQNALITPYINSGVQEVFPGHTIWGIPESMVRDLKNKEKSHQLIEELAVTGIQIPEPGHRIFTVNQLVDKADNFLQEIEELYATHNMSNKYTKVGMMLRAAESDGNYGAVMLYQEQGTFYVVPNGEATKKLTCKQKEDALITAQQFLSQSINKKGTQAIVATRLVDVEDSPGLSALIIQGKFIPFGWNGQMQENGNAACTGTSTYHPKTQAAANMQQRFEAASQEQMETFLRIYAKREGLDFNKITGFVNMDIIQPGEEEQALLNNMGLPLTYYVPEFNPRATNLTQALVEGTLVCNTPQTAQELQRLLRDGILTLDRKPLYGADPKAVRAALFDVHQKLQREDTRNGVVVRVPTDPMAVIYYGDIKTVRIETQKAIAT